MLDAFSIAKRSEAVQTRSAVFGTQNGSSPRPSPQRGEGGSLSEFSEVELIPGNAEVFDNVGDDTSRHIAGMPRESDQAIRTKRIRVMPVAAGGAKKFTTDFAEATFQLAAIPGGVFAHGSGGENEFVTEGHGNRAASFEQCFQMDFGGLLKAERGFTPVASVRMAARQQRRFGNPHAVFILPELHFREWNDHNAVTVTRSASGVKRGFDD